MNQNKGYEYYYFRRSVFLNQVDQMQLSFIMLSACLLHLLCPAATQSLNGGWKLRKEQIQQLSHIQSEITFQFDQDFNPTTNHITNYLTITACNVILYTYATSPDGQSTIDLNFLLIGRNTGRDCLGLEINYIRTTLETIFYFYLLANTLILIDPSSKIPFKLDRIQTIPNIDISGQWKIIDTHSNTSHGSLVIANSTQIHFCQGKKKYSFKLVPTVQMNLKQIMSSGDKSCQISKLLSTNKYIYRLNSLNQPNILTIYDSNMSRILQMIQVGTWIPSKSIVFESTGNNLQVKDSRNNTSIQIIRNLTNTNVENASNNNQTINKENTTATNKNMSTITSNRIAENTQNPLILPFSLQKVYGVWTITSITPSLNTSYSSYNVIINSARIMLSGGCNTIFITYSFQSNILVAGQITTTNNKCNTSLDTPISNLLLTNGNAFTIHQNHDLITLQIDSQNNQVQLALLNNSS